RYPPRRPHHRHRPTPGRQGIPRRGPGDQGIIDFIIGYGHLLAAGVEGTGSYGAELSRILTRRGIRVVEVMRPNRQARRLQG
ncbi:hypothetical protein LD110_23495, partial [Arthrobacter sp. M4]|nr:hypothetical protein [Arthrobacter sp. M4]